MRARHEHPIATDYYSVMVLENMGEVFGYEEALTLPQIIGYVKCILEVGFFHLLPRCCCLRV